MNEQGSGIVTDGIEGEGKKENFKLLIKEFVISRGKCRLVLISVDPRLSIFRDLFSSGAED